MNRAITISEEAYARLEAMAAQQGLSVVELLSQLGEPTDQDTREGSSLLGEEALAQLVALHEATFPHARDATAEERASVDRTMQQKVRQRLRRRPLHHEPLEGGLQTTVRRDAGGGESHV
jgi:hypothetical protein